VATPDENELRELVSPLIDTPAAEIPSDANLILLGLTSLEIMRLVSRWRKAKLPVIFEELAATPTIDGWTAHFAGLETTR
jgi:aryl carrier-like protein